MSDLKLKNDDSIAPSTDAFGAKVSDDDLLVPSSVYLLIHRLGGRTPEEFIELAKTYPSEFVKSMKWEPADVGAATTSLMQKLRDHVDPVVLNPPRGRARGYGAMNPFEV